MAKPDFLEIEYFETYYWANIINNVINDPYNYDYLGSLGGFFGDENTVRFFKPFPKTSALHGYIMYMIETIHDEDLDNTDIKSFKTGKTNFWVEGASDFYALKYDKFDDWIVEAEKDRADIDEDDVTDYIVEFKECGPFYDILEKMSEEIFFIIFSNRDLLHKFNEIVSPYIQEIKVKELDDEYIKFFKKDGVLKRVSIPFWVQKAVYYRDRGKCNNCHKDVTGQVNIGNNKNFDHIIPLEIGGINDVTNIQLLCEGCNKRKKAKVITTSKKYEKWY